MRWQSWSVSNEGRSPTDSSTRSFLLTAIFLLIFLVRLKYSCNSFFFSFSPLNSPNTSIWESIFCDSPFTLTFDKCEAIPLHFREKKSGKTTTFLLRPSIYELISQIGKVLPNFLFSHHHFVQNGELQTFNFYLMGGAILAKWQKWKMRKMFTVDLYGNQHLPSLLHQSLQLWVITCGANLTNEHFWGFTFFRVNQSPFFWRESQCQHLLFYLHLAKESTNILMSMHGLYRWWRRPKSTLAFKYSISFAYN